MSTLLPHVPQGDVIPPIVHQTFPTKNLPAEITENRERLKNANPEWDFRLYDDADIEDFIRTHYGQEMLGYFHAIHASYGAAKADFFRYLVLYRLGGIYLDIKSSVTLPLTKVAELGTPFLLTHWDNGPGRNEENYGMHRRLRHINGGEFIQWAIVSVPGHPFLKAVIEKMVHSIAHYNPFIHGIGQKGTLMVTGPIAYTLAIAPLVAMHPHQHMHSYKDAGLVYSIYGTMEIHKKIFTTHYTRLFIPLIAPKTLGDKFLWIAAIARFFVVTFLKKLRRKLKSFVT